MEKKQVVSGLVTICVVFAILGAILIGTGFYKITSYNNPDSDYSFDTEYINSYVGGDAYNYIINGTYFTAYAVMGTGALIISAITGSAEAILSIKYNEKTQSQIPEKQIPTIQDQIQ